MEQYTESYCLAILITNLKHRKRYPDSITVAKCAEFLHELHGSFAEVAQMVGVHSSVIKKWVNLASAPEYLRQCVKEERIYPVAAFAILSAFKDTNKRIEIARAVNGWGEPEIVRFIKFVKENRDIPVSECKRKFISKVIGRLTASNNSTMDDLGH